MRTDHRIQKILLIGLLAYSGVSWSKTLMMECFLIRESKSGLIQSGKVSTGIWKLETDEDPNSDDLLTIREDGEWRGICGDPSRTCRKGDDSVKVSYIVDGEEIMQVFDFRFLEWSSKPRGGWPRVCEKIK